MSASRERRQSRLQIGTLSCCALAPGVLGYLHVPLLLAATGLLLLLVVLAVVALGAAFAPQDRTRRAAARTLDLLLRLAPWYTPH
jgi:hypothetical protein